MMAAQPNSILNDFWGWASLLMSVVCRTPSGGQGFHGDPRGCEPVRDRLNHGRMTRQNCRELLLVTSTHWG
jgi:hypothetical protein